jgi:hypothetical protein
MNLWSIAAEILDPQKLKNNQFVTAALIAAPATAITYALRSVPKKVGSSLKRATTITLRFNSDMGDYEAISRFVTKHVIYERFSRNFNYQTQTKWDSDSFSDKTQHLGLTAGYGNHIGFYRRRLVMVNRHIDEGNQTAKFKEHLVLTFFGGRKLVHQFAAEIMEKAGTNFGEFNSVPIWINSGNWWNRAGTKPLRKLNSVFTSGGAGRKLYQAVREFEEKRDEHHRLGLPHHLGILLFGVPGCGKSSLIHALASELERSIFYLNLGSVESDKELTDLVTSNRDWSKALLVLEDFDSAGVAVNRDDDHQPTVAGKPTRKKKNSAAPKKDKPTVTLSTMLNVLDGLISPDGLVVIATTNHPDKLDAALKREGRFDQQFELGRLGYDEFVEMCGLFGVEPDGYAMERGSEMTGAAMRAMIINPTKEAA